MRNFLIVFLLVLLVEGRAYALCTTPYITATNTVLTYSHGGEGYNPFDVTRRLQVGSFTVGDLVNVGCKYYVVLSAGGSGNASARRATLASDVLNYRAYTDGSGAQNWASAGGHGQSQVIHGEVGLVVLPSTTHNFTWDVTPLQVRHSTSAYYTDTVVATLYAQYLLGWAEAGSVTYTIRVPVKSSVDVSVGSSAVFELTRTAHGVDLGDLSNGISKSFNTVVRSNSGHIVRMSSVNGQKLKHKTLPATIDYDFTFDGLVADLSAGSPVIVKNSNALTPVNGTPYATGVTIKNMNRLEPVGDYEDVINVTVSAQ